jgi:peptidoglycan/LPS O-acetylase OafA/YrhL
MTSPVTPAQHRYLPALDGLRALAVAAVIAYHLGLPWARGGYLGVDLFFVLSGYLITGLLLGEQARTGAIGLRAFYIRRARRLLPALLIVLAAVVVYAAAGGGGFDQSTLRGDVASALAYVANWRFVASGQGYFAQFTVPSPLRHMWSLAIEEQFYLLWPLALLALLRVTRRSRRSRGHVLAVVLGLVAGSAALMAALYHPGHDPSRVYYGTDTRGFELLIGAALAIALAGRAQPAAKVRAGLHGAALASLAVLVVAWSRAADSASWMYRGGFLACALLAAVVVASVSRAEPGPLGRALSVRPLRWVGQLSYGIYLWHWPVIDLVTHARTGISGPRLQVLQVALTLVAASASYYLVERPVRWGALPGWRGALAAPATAVTIAAVALVTAAPPALALAAPHPAAPANGPTTTTLPSIAPLTGIRRPTPADPLRVMIVGDSVMFDASPGITTALQATGAVHVDTEAVFGFGLTQSYPWRTAWPRLLAQDRPELVIGLFGGWDAKAALGKGAGWYTGLVDDAVGVLSSQGARVLLLEYPQNRPPEIPGRPTPDQAANELGRRTVNRVFASEPSAHAGVVSYLPTASVLEAGGRFAAFLPGADGVPERVRKRDDVHFCPAGAARVGALVVGALRPLYGLPAPDPSWASGAWRGDPRYDDPHGTCA